MKYWWLARMIKLVELWKELDKVNCLAVILGILAGLFLGPWLIIILTMIGYIAFSNWPDSWVGPFLCSLAATSVICLLVYIFKISHTELTPSWQDIKDFVWR